MRHRALVLLPLLAGCAAMQPRVTMRGARTGPAGVRGVGIPVDTGAAAPDPRGTGRDAGTAFPVENSEVRRVCRASARPGGWMATAYVEAPGECPERSGPDARYNAAVIVRVDHRARGTVLDVCADQVVPADWVQSGTPEPAAAAGCPGAGKDGAGASVRMRRVR